MISPHGNYDQEVASCMEVDLWGDHPDHPRVDWQVEVGMGNTQLGYWQWVQHRIDSWRESGPDPETD
jgi:hypothetical protein